MRVLGIDEAGRGCVLGDLFVAGFFMEDLDEGALRAAGAGDSKGMSAQRRERARAPLQALGSWATRRVSAAHIDAGNLNTLEEACIADLITTFQPHRVIIDALGAPSTLPRAIARLKERVHPLDLDVIWVPKADRDHPVVGAASIFAKTERDRALSALADSWGKLGSGYPSDPATKMWLRAWYSSGKAWPDFVRTRWGTIRDFEPDLSLFDR